MKTWAEMNKAERDLVCGWVLDVIKGYDGDGALEASPLYSEDLANLLSEMLANEGSGPGGGFDDDVDWAEVVDMCSSWLTPWEGES